MSEPSDSEPILAVVLNRDLLFGSRIRNALAGLGLAARFAATTAAFVDAVDQHRDAMAIGIIDMNGPVSWDEIKELLDRHGASTAPLLAFGPHMDVEGRRAAKAAGITRIVSNGQFHGDMAGLIERYRRRSMLEQK